MWFEFCVIKWEFGVLVLPSKRRPFLSVGNGKHGRGSEYSWEGDWDCRCGRYGITSCFGACFGAGCQPKIAGGGERRPSWHWSWLDSARAAGEACSKNSWGWIEQVDGTHPWRVRPDSCRTREGAAAPRYKPPTWEGPYAVSTRSALRQSWSQISVGPTSAGT